MRLRQASIGKKGGAFKSFVSFSENGRWLATVNFVESSRDKMSRYMRCKKENILTQLPFIFFSYNNPCVCTLRSWFGECVLELFDTRKFKEFTGKRKHILTAIWGSFHRMNSFDLGTKKKKKLHLGVFVLVNLDSGWVYASQSFFQRVCPSMR